MPKRLSSCMTSPVAGSNEAARASQAQHDTVRGAWCSGLDDALAAHTEQQATQKRLNQLWLQYRVDPVAAESGVDPWLSNNSPAKFYEKRSA